MQNACTWRSLRYLEYNAIMITVDANEPKVMDVWIGQSAPVERRRINQQPNQTIRVFPDYVLNHPDNPYIAYNDLPKIQNFQKLLPALYRSLPVALALASR